jgi:ABC-2 type transport system ATP-binding protein
MSKNIIEISGVSKDFGKLHAVDGIYLAIEKGEIVGFVGVNGAGKSTTISMLLGFIAPTSGTVQLFGQEVTLANAHKSHQHVGYAAGDMEMFDRLTARQYLDFVLGQYGVKSRTRLDELIAKFQPQLDKKIADLSRGNKQKIALIAAFAASPKVVILDEPTSGLDPLMQQEFLQLIREEQKKGTTVFMSSHILSEVADVCTRVVLIAGGKIIRDGDASDYETLGKKRVRVVTQKPAKAPKGAGEVEIRKSAKSSVLTFVYTGKMTDLQVWVASLKGVLDITIAEHGLEDAVFDLYKKEDER